MNIPPSDIITLDFETYFDAQYTLKKQATSEYIRDERFKAQCVGIKVGTDDVVWIPDIHVEEALHSIDWPAYALLAHHTQFDGFILGDRFGLRPAYYLDTLSMGRGLHSVGMGASLDALAQHYGIGNKLPDILSKTKGIRDLPPEIMADLGLYCAVDTQLCFDLFQRMVVQFPQTELDLIDETCRMFCEPVLLVDIPRAQSALKLEKDTKAQKILDSEQDPTDLRSSIKFAAVLRVFGVEPPMKISPTTGEPTFAFAKSDAGLQELMVHDDAAVRAVVEARLAVKSTLNETRAQRLLDEGANGKTLPVYLKYYGAHCVQGDTEVLTPEGWQRIDEWGGGLIAQYHGDKRPYTEFLPAKRYVGPEIEDWVRVEAPYVSGMFTYGHTMTPDVKAGDMLTRHTTGLPAAALNFQSLERSAITEEQIRVLVMTQADGSWNVRHQRRTTLRYHFKKPRKIARCEELLTAAELVYTRRKAEKNGTVTFYIAARHIPDWLTPEKKTFGSWLLHLTRPASLAMREELFFWDGGVSQDGTLRYNTNNPVNAEWVQTMGHLSWGRKTRISYHSGMYRVSFIQRGGWRTMIKKKHVQAVTEKARAYCPTTQTGYWLARHEGNIFVTGNTGRWSGGNKMNLQNLPRGGELRRSIIAPPGHVVCVADSAQIEARMLAWVAGEIGVLEQFRNGEDVYKHMAAKIYGVPIEQVTSKYRFVGKVATLGLGYGMGWRKFLLAITLGLMGPKMHLEPEEAQTVVNGYRHIRHKTVAFWRVCDDMLQHMLYDMDMEYGVLRVDGLNNRIYLPNGMYLEYPGLCQSNDGFVYFDYENADIMARGRAPNPKRAKKAYGGSIAENITQALARIVVGEQLLAIAKRYKVATTTHDEVVDIVPEAEAEAGLEFMLEVMCTPPDWAPDLPLDAEGGFAREYSK